MSLPESLRAHDHAEIADFADAAVELAQRWVAASADVAMDAAARRLAGMLSDPNGLGFAVGFVDGVVRPEDERVAARNLAALVPILPRFLSWPLRAAFRAAALAAPVLPGVVVPVSRRVLRRMVRHLVVDATDTRLGPAIAKLRGPAGSGIRLNVNLLGEAVLGDGEAQRRLEGTQRLIDRPDVDYVSIKVSSTVAPHSSWSFDDAVTHAVEALLPLYRRAQAGRTFINLDMEEYRDLDLTIEVFSRILGRPEFASLEAGIVLQAYLPDALAAMIRLQEWAAARVCAGGAPIKVRVVKGANLPMERVDAELHGWPLATWGSKAGSDASYKAVLDYALRPEHTANVRIGVAGHNLFDIALAWLVARDRAVADAVEIEMLLGMAAAQAEVVRREVGSVLLYTPVVHPAEFDVAIAYLIRRLEEGASQENFMSAVFELGSDEALFERERERFLASVAAIPRGVPAAHRVQDRTAEPAHAVRGDFANTPDTDPSLRVNREWGAGIRGRMPRSTLGQDVVDAHTISTEPALDALVETAVAAGEAWRALGADARAEILHSAGDLMEVRRADLLEVMGSECGKLLDQGDAEVSEAIDFAHYYAERGRDLDHIEGARFQPARLTLVTPPWNFPVAIPAGSTLAALASGSPVVIKPARQARRSGAVMVQALWDAGVPRDVLQYVQLDGRDLGQRLVSHPAVENVVLTGGYETAELFRGFRADLPLLAETSGKNAIIVTPSADLDLAAKDVAYSAFGHAGQKCSAASLVVLVGSVARSERFRRQLVDAVTSLRVGVPWDESAQVGPLIGPADGKLLRALTSLDPGQSWLIEPERLDEKGALWRPGVREGVQRGSEFHLVEYFGPVLGIMTAATLDEAIALVNEIEYGLTSGLHSLDEAEIATWLRTIEAGNLYVNRGTTGAIVQRQPFGGWKKSVVGPGAKAGGPNYLVGLGRWTDAALNGAGAASDAVAQRAVAAAERAGLGADDVAWLSAALGSDARAAAAEFAVVRDVTGLECEQNAFRYAAVPVTVRWEGERVVELVRTIAAGARVGAQLSVTSPAPLPGPIAQWLEMLAVEHRVESADGWAARARELAASAARIRLVGGDAAALHQAVDGSPALTVYAGEVVSAGRIETLAYLREQAVSITAHRFGTPRRYGIPALVG